MKLSFLVWGIGFFFANICGMDVPTEKTKSTCSQDISPTVALKAKEDKKRFEKYDFDHPDKFLIFLKHELSPQSELEYIVRLQRAVSYLQVQHRYIQVLLRAIFLRNEFNKKINQEAITAKIVHPGIKPLRTQADIIFRKLSPPTTSDLNYVIAHRKMIGDADFKPEYLSGIFDAMLSENNSSWIKNLAVNKLMNYQLDILKSAITPVQQKISLFDFVSAEILASTKREPRIIAQNLKVLKEITEATLELTEKQNKAEAKSLDACGVIEKQLGLFVNATDLYLCNESYYVMLYEIAVRELRTKISALLRANPSDKTIMKHLNSLPEGAALAEAGIIPKILPATLAPINKIQATIPIPLFEKEFEVAKKEWERKNKEVVAQELKKKKKIRPNKEKIKIESIVGPKESVLPLAELEEEEISTPVERVKIKVDDRGSYLLEGDETDSRITIHDPKNRTENIIFKSDKPNQIKQLLPPINYTPWVNQWFGDPQQALIAQGYTTEGTKKFTAVHLHWKPIALHSFARLVDDSIKEWGNVTTIPSRRDPSRQDLLVTIPGMMVYPDGKEETGVYAYLIDSSNGQWYHRMFEPQTGQKLINDLFEKGYFSPDMQGYYDVYFPPLGSK